MRTLFKAASWLKEDKNMPAKENVGQEILVPELGESVLEATVSRWLKQEGERVRAGEVLVELETDKVNLEVGAKSDGVLKKIERQENEDVQVGDILGIIGPGDGDSQEETAEAPPGDAREGNGRKSDEQVDQKPDDEEKIPDEAAADEQVGEDRVTPVAERLAREHKLEINKIKGSGPGGRITKSDVESYLKEMDTKPAAPEKPPAPDAPTGEREAKEPAPQKPRSAEDGRNEERIRLSRRRRTIAQRLVEAQQTAAMLTTFNEIDMTAVMEMRARRNEAFLKRYDVKLGFMSFFVKACIGALKAYPRVNAEMDGDEMVLKHYYDIGIAVGAEEGLVVPVLRGADKMSFAEIEKQIKVLVDKTEQGTLSIDDLRGGTFTITNGGVFGSLLSTPILSPPQVGILGMHKIEKRPVVVDDQMVIRPMMYVALSYDHRIVDGREAVQFLVRIKEMIEDPETLLLEG
jgi:2-oxoglutarate dehydrogenase E2 component (dihydrolipoamide succinyltransferase)